MPQNFIACDRGQSMLMLAAAVCSGPTADVTLLLYSYARGNRSSRGIERACREDVTYKLITAMRVPDHSTIAEFRRRHKRALGKLSPRCSRCARRRGWLRLG